MKKAVIAGFAVLAAGIALIIVNISIVSGRAQGEDTSGNYWLMLLGILVTVLGVSFLLGLLLSQFCRFLVRKLPWTNFIVSLPIVLYPYLYVIVGFTSGFSIGFEEMLSDASRVPVFYLRVFLLGLLCGLLLLSSVITGFRLNYSGVLPAYKGAWLNMMIKLIHIPAYIVHFLIGALGLVASVWGIGFILFAVIIDLFTIAVSGTYALAAVINMRRSGKIGTGAAVVLAVFSYIYCIDVVISIAMYVICKSKDSTAKAAQYTQYATPQYLSPSETQLPQPQNFDQMTGQPLQPQPQQNFDPMTGQPIQPQPQQNFDPMTGQPIQPQPQQNFDPMTGQPLPPQPQQNFDPMTGQPLQPQPQQNFDPVTGQPIQLPQQQNYDSMTGQPLK